MPPTTQSLDTSYPRDKVEASYSGLLEISRTLAAYREALILVGGWVPFLLLRDHPSTSGDFTHVGSADIDLAIVPELVPDEEYATIQALLLERGWSQLVQDGALFRYHKPIGGVRGSEPQDIVVDFLTAESPASEGRRHRPIQHDLKARVTYG